MKQFNSHERLSPPENKDWSDILLGWPLLVLVALTVIGFFFSKLMMSSRYQVFSACAAIVVAATFWLAAVIRYRRGKVRWPPRFPFNRPLLVAVGGIGLLYWFAYMALGHGIPVLASPAMRKIESHTVVVVRKFQTGYQSGFRGVLVVKGLGGEHDVHVAPEFWEGIHPGDRIEVRGRNSVFGLFVDEVQGPQG